MFFRFHRGDINAFFRNYGGDISEEPHAVPGFNVDLDNPRITDAMRLLAAEMVNAEGFIQRLGWDHMLREQGADLSQGEGQLLTFARTMAQGEALYAKGEYRAAHQLWQRVAPLDPENVELQKKLERSERVIRNLESLNTP